MKKIRTIAWLGLLAGFIMIASYSWQIFNSPTPEQLQATTAVADVAKIDYAIQVTPTLAPSATSQPVTEAPTKRPTLSPTATKEAAATAGATAIALTPDEIPTKAATPTAISGADAPPLSDGGVIQATPVNDETVSAESIIPTPTPASATLAPATLAPEASTAAATLPPTAEPTLGPTAEPTQVPTQPPTNTNSPAPISISYRERFGALGSSGDVAVAQASGLPIGSFMTWDFYASSPIPSNVNLWQMVRVGAGGPKRSYGEIEAALAAMPGRIWVIGNEPDVIWQDNITAGAYAQVYHDLYYFIKARDPSAKVAVGAVSTPTPLRRWYLDVMLDSYLATYGEKLPADVWTVHAYVLREERGSWGVDIPPGFGGVDTGMLYEVEDHANYNILNGHMLDFRAWMAERGYGNVALAVTEFGILLPADYGFTPDVVSDFMRGTVNFYLSASNGNGYAPDGSKLVQWWFWYNLNDSSEEFAVSNLLNKQNGGLTPIGSVYASYLN